METGRALDQILNKPSKIKIIRALISRRGGFKASGREIARLARLTPPAAHAALKELHGQGIVKQEILGRPHIYSLAVNNNVIEKILRPMFKGEVSIREEIENHLAKRIQGRNVYIIAGSNGSGKTTFARKFLPDYAKCIHFINTDLIAQGLSPFSPSIAAMKAGRLVIEQIGELADKGSSFAFETTLAGRAYLNTLKKLKSKGYSLHLFFLWVPAVELALARIKDRVADGGHDVPVQDVKRRFHRGTLNLFKFYRPLLDSWMLFNNSDVTPGLIAKEKEGKLEIVDMDLYSEIVK
ncbi:MAG: zeta toxin family protein [Candidatus Omnitrophota bacterium]